MRKLLLILIVGFYTSIANADTSSASEGELHIKSDRKGATIYIDGKKKGIVGDGFTKITVDEGDHKVRILQKTKEWIYEGREDTFVSGKSSIEIFINTVASPTKYRKEKLEQNRIAREKREEEARVAKAIRLKKERELRDKMLAKEKKSLNIDKSLDKKRGTVSIGKLMWMRCSVGQTWTGNTCNGSAKTYEFYPDAAAHKYWPKIAKKSLELSKFKHAGFTNWRLPTTKELRSIVYCTKGTYANQGRICNKGSNKPTIDKKLFPNTPTDKYWSQKPSRSNQISMTMFDNGMSMTYSTARNGKVRLVRSRN